MHILDRISSLFQGTNWLIIPAAFLAIIFHEISHGYVAYLLGDTTARDRGRLSLNPIKHVDIVGLICMVLFGFGWAKPVPISAYYFKNRRLGICLVSLAGPVSNILMAFLSVVLAVAIITFYTPQAAFMDTAIKILLEILVLFAVLNIGLAVFNLLPIPPLDGSKILFSFLPSRAYKFVLNYERYGMLVLIILINTPFFDSLLKNARSFLFETITYVAQLIFT